MFTMAVGQSDDIEPRDAIREAIRQCRDSLAGLTPKAGLLFVAFESFDPSMVAEVRTAFPGIRVVGSTSAAEMGSATGYHEDSVTLAVFASDNVEFSCGAGRDIARDPDAAASAAVSAALEGLTRPPRLAVMLSDPLDGQRGMEAVRRALPTDVVVVGGASSGLTLGQPRPNFLFLDDDVVDDGLVLLLLSGDLAFSLAVGTGFRPIGPTGVVTASDYGVIRQIDGKPATAFTAGYLDIAGPATFGNPLAIQEAAADEWYIRVLLSQDAATGEIQHPGRIPVGSTVRLTTATADEIVGAARDAVSRATRAFPEGVSPSAALVFSCAVRKFLLGTRTGEEVVHAQALLPAGLPLAGMYCVGEIAPVSGAAGSRFHNESFVAVLLGG